MSEITYAKIPTEALAIARQLTRSQFAVWTYLWEIDPFGNRLCDIPNPESIAQALGIHERTITRATERLEELNLFTFRINSWQAKNLFGTKAQKAENLIAKKISIEQPDDLACCDKTIPNLTTRSKSGSNDPNLDQTIQKMTTRSEIGSDCQNQGSKIASEADSSSSHYYSLPIQDPLISIQDDFQKKGEEESLKNSDQEKAGKEENVESIQATLKIVQKSLNQNDPQNQNLKTEDKPESVDKVEDHSSAAPPRFFAKLLDFVIYQAKQDPKILSPETWARTCLSRNFDEWCAKWDTWEKSRAQTTTHKPEAIDIPTDLEERRRITKDARKHLPEWMRRQYEANETA